MAFYYGQGGRPKGAKNKATDLHRKCEEMKVDVFKEMLELAMNEEDTTKRFNRFSECAQYLYAKPKEAEVTAEQVRAYLESVAALDDSKAS